MSKWTKTALENMLEDVVNELNLSEAAIKKYGPIGTAPSELVRLVLQEKDRCFQQLQIENKRLKNLKHIVTRIVEHYYKGDLMTHREIAEAMKQALKGGE